tara:strand:- start:45 stop:761 length:717 start_codon:yes stop_codon:yes gene_type:complete
MEQFKEIGVNMSDDFINQYEKEYIESLFDVLHSNGPKTFTNIIMGLGVVKILETSIKHIRNRKRHFFCFSYYFHLLLLVLFSCSNIFLSDQGWEGEWLSIHLYYFIDSFILIFLIYFSVPSEKQMNGYFLSLKDFYKNNMKIWTPLYLLYYLFVDFAVWVDKSIACDPEYPRYCYNYTWLETMDAHIWIYPICGAILILTKNVWFALFFYWFTNVPFLAMIFSWEEYWIDYPIQRGLE